MSSGSVHLGFAPIRFELVNDLVHFIVSDRRSEIGPVDYVVAVTADDAHKLLGEFGPVARDAYRAHEERLNAGAPAWGTRIEVDDHGSWRIAVVQHVQRGLIYAKREHDGVVDVSSVSGPFWRPVPVAP